MGRIILVKMKEKLMDSRQTGDFWLDLEQIGVGVDLPQHLKLGSGKTLVYMFRVNQNYSPGLLREIVVSGYLVQSKSFLGFFKEDKIRVVSENKREGVRSELSNKLALEKVRFAVTFWE